MDLVIPVFDFYDLYFVDISAPIDSSIDLIKHKFGRKSRFFCFSHPFLLSSNNKI